MQKESIYMHISFPVRMYNCRILAAFAWISPQRYYSRNLLLLTIAVFGKMCLNPSMNIFGELPTPCNCSFWQDVPESYHEDVIFRNCRILVTYAWILPWRYYFRNFLLLAIQDFGKMCLNPTIKILFGNFLLLAFQDSGNMCLNPTENVLCWGICYSLTNLNLLLS